MSEGFKDALHTVFDSKDVTGGKLPVDSLSSCVHEGWGVWEEVKAFHHGVVFFLFFLVPLCNGSRDAHEHLFGGFCYVALVISPEVAVVQDLQGGWREV